MADFWQEDDAADAPPAVADDVVDLAFPLRGRTLPADHAWALGSAIASRLPWFADEPLAALHLVHTAASGNGWISPEDRADGLLYLSRRTRLTLRVPHERVASCAALVGAVLEVRGHRLELGTPVRHALSPLTTLHARHVVDTDDADESAFMTRAADALERLGIRCRRMLAGRAGRFAFPDGPVATRSLLLAGLDRDASQRLQRLGLGPGRVYGFGVFLPHKAVGGR